MLTGASHARGTEPDVQGWQERLVVTLRKPVPTIEGKPGGTHDTLRALYQAVIGFADVKPAQSEDDLADYVAPAKEPMCLKHTGIRQKKQPGERVWFSKQTMAAFRMWKQSHRDRIFNSQVSPETRVNL